MRQELLLGLALFLTQVLVIGGAALLVGVVVWALDSALRLPRTGD